MNAYLELRDVSVSFNGFRAVSDLNMSVQKGELRCLIGPNGAGKTTALDLICGKIKRTSGSIVLNGTALDLLEEYQIARAGVGRKFQVPSVFKELSVSENLKVAQNRHAGVWSNLRWGADKSDIESIERLADLIGLSNELAKPAAYLSHGQTQWLEIGMLARARRRSHSDG